MFETLGSFLKPATPSPNVEKIQPIDLHYFYAGNCYQHAIGYQPVIMVFQPIKEPHDDVINGMYLMIQPGGLDRLNEAKLNKIQTIDLLLSNCERDGITIIGSDFEQRAGFRTLAVFVERQSDKDPDYHFAFWNQDNVWEDKLPMRRPKTYKSVSEIEETSKYEFVCYALAPDNMTLTFPSLIHHKPVTIKQDSKLAELLVLYLDRPEAGTGLGHIPFQIFPENNHIVFDSKPDQKLPMPLLETRTMNLLPKHIA
ncbi:MAG: hypothetical protein AAF569_04240 [Pseudomonadota bacterium]